jgi:hypothetical protein
MKAFRRKARRGERSQRMDIKAIRQRPAGATYWEGCLWGYPRKARSENAGILDVFSPISNPSRGAHIINGLRLFIVNLPRHSRLYGSPTANLNSSVDIGFVRSVLRDTSE